MPKFFVKQDQINKDIINILDEDVNHIKNVLRLQREDEINICNLTNGENFLCVIDNIEKDTIRCKILKKIESKSESNVYIHLFQGVPKLDKMETIIQKTTELGIREITPVLMKRCIAKIEDKKEKSKIDRWQKIALTAAKQSRRDIVPKINNTINLENICKITSTYDIVLLAYENEESNLLKEELSKIKEIVNKEIKIALIIGPEGGIDIKEKIFLTDNRSKISNTRSQNIKNRNCTNCTC